MKRYSPSAPLDGAPPPGEFSPPPHSESSPNRAAPVATDPAGSEASGLPEEDPLVLDEIDRIIYDLQTRRSGSSVAGESVPWAIPYASSPPALGANVRDEFGGVPSGYFEEHLDAARRAVGHIQEEVGELADTSSLLRQRVAVAEDELERIAQEYRFVRDRSAVAGSPTGSDPSVPLWSEGPPDSPASSSATDSPDISSGSFTAIQAASADGPAPVYTAFTVDRYNQTVESLRTGRTRLVAWTLLLSAAVGVALVLVMLFSPVVYPPLWVALLPLVWVVPIPYFLLAFRGTQRVLQHSSLQLPGAR